MKKESVSFWSCLASLALPVVFATLAGCQANRNHMDAGGVATVRSAHDLLRTDSAFKGTVLAEKNSTDRATVSARTSQASAETPNRMRDGSDARSSRTSRPLSLTSHGTKQEVLKTGQERDRGPRTVRLASWTTGEPTSLALDQSVPSQQAGEAEGTSPEHDLGKTAQQINNPVGELWMLVNQYDYTVFEDSNGDSHGFHNLKIQPVMPMQLTDEWRLIVRPVIPVVYNDVPQGDGNWDREFGLGDVVLLNAFTTVPADSKWLWGVGPTFMFPTATDDSLGTEKWSAGPAVLGVYLGEKWIVGGVWQNWFSFAGDGDRESVNLMDFQYFLQYRITPTLQVGMTPNIQYDWAERDWTVPVGLGVNNTFMFGKLPIKLGVEAQYYVHQPDDFGPEWNFRFFIVPVVPAPEWSKKPLFAG